MSSEDSVKRNVVRRSSLENASREPYSYPDISRETTAQGFGGKPYPFFVPSTVKSTLGSPTALAIGAFSTTLTTLSLSLMEWRGVTTTNAYIGNVSPMPEFGSYATNELDSSSSVRLLFSSAVRATINQLGCSGWHWHDYFSAVGVGAWK